MIFFSTGNQPKETSKFQYYYSMKIIIITNFVKRLYLRNLFAAQIDEFYNDTK